MATGPNSYNKTKSKFQILLKITHPITYRTAYGDLPTSSLQRVQLWDGAASLVGTSSPIKAEVWAASHPSTNFRSSSCRNSPGARNYNTSGSHTRFQNTKSTGCTTHKDESASVLIFKAVIEKHFMSLLLLLKTHFNIEFFVNLAWSSLDQEGQSCNFNLTPAAGFESLSHATIPGSPLQPSPPLLSAGAASKASPRTRTAPSSYVNASKLSSHKTAQCRWKEHESRASNACKIMAHKHLFIKRKHGEERRSTGRNYVSIGKLFFTVQAFSFIISTAQDTLLSIPHSAGSLVCCQGLMRQALKLKIVVKSHDSTVFSIVPSCKTGTKTQNPLQAAKKEWKKYFYMGFDPI